MEIASVLAGVNVCFLLVLTGVWVRNYTVFKSQLVLGLVAFGGVMLTENVVALYFFLTMQGFYAMSSHVQQVVLILRALEFMALTFLTYVTVK